VGGFDLGRRGVVSRDNDGLDRQLAGARSPLAR